MMRAISSGGALCELAHFAGYHAIAAPLLTSFIHFGVAQWNSAGYYDPMATEFRIAMDGSGNGDCAPIPYAATGLRHCSTEQYELDMDTLMACGYSRSTFAT
jgi:hypothetical protein